MQHFIGSLIGLCFISLIVFRLPTLGITSKSMVFSIKCSQIRKRQTDDVIASISSAGNGQSGALGASSSTGLIAGAISSAAAAGISSAGENEESGAAVSLGAASNISGAVSTPKAQFAPGESPFSNSSDELPTRNATDGGETTLKVEPTKPPKKKSKNKKSSKAPDVTSTGSVSTANEPVNYKDSDYENDKRLPPQNPGLIAALNTLRTNAAAKSVNFADLLTNAEPGKDYPVFTEIPEPKSFSCAAVNQAGFYADIDTDCQVIRRCDINGNLWSYLCPNLTRFNQIELICDWFWNIDCSQAKQFYDYSNARLYHATWKLLDTPDGPHQGHDNESADQPAGDSVIHSKETSKIEKSNNKNSAT